MTIIPFWGARFPDAYDILQRTTDPEGHIVRAVECIAPWHGRTVVDLGCGRGDMAQRMAGTADWVYAVDPDPAMHEQWQSRRSKGQGLHNLSWHQAEASDLPVHSRGIDAMYCFWSYFFGKGAEPGLVEAKRVLCPGGYLVVVQNHGFDELSSLWPESEYACLDWADWFEDQGFRRHVVCTRWAFPSEDAAVILLARVWGPESVNRFLSRGILEYEYKAAIYYRLFYEV